MYTQITKRNSINIKIDLFLPYLKTLIHLKFVKHFDTIRKILKYL